MKEAQEHENNIMITLTYNDENVPKNHIIEPQTGEYKETLTLDKRDVQLFMKRLRKKFGANIRYYCAGEYGSTKEYYTWKGEKKEGTGRPHYHLILFNLKVEDMIPYKISQCEWSKEKNILYKSKDINKLWNKGHADLNEVNYETCCYVARYVTKKYYGANSKEHYEEQGKIPEFSLMSRKPGIAQTFYEKNKEKFENQETFWQRTKKGIKALPNIRYFDKQLEKEKPDLAAEIKKMRERKARQYFEACIANETELNKVEYTKNQIYQDKKYNKLKRDLI